MKAKNILKAALAASVLVGCSANVSKKSEELRKNFFLKNELKKIEKNIKIAKWYDDLGIDSEYKDSLVNLIRHELPIKTEGSNALAFDKGDHFLIYSNNDDFVIDVKNNTRNSFYGIERWTTVFDMSDKDMDKIKAINHIGEDTPKYYFFRNRENYWQVPVDIILKFLGHDLKEAKDYAYDKENKLGIYSVMGTDAYLSYNKMTKGDVVNSYNKVQKANSSNNGIKSLDDLAIIIDKTIFLETNGKYDLSNIDVSTGYVAFKKNKSDEIIFPLTNLYTKERKLKNKSSWTTPSEEDWTEWRTIKESLNMIGIDVRSYKEIYKNFNPARAYISALYLGDKKNKRHPERNYESYGGLAGVKIRLDRAANWSLGLGGGLAFSKGYETTDTTSSYIKYVHLPESFTRRVYDSEKQEEITYETPYDYHKFNEFKVKSHIQNFILYSDLEAHFSEHFGIKAGVYFLHEIENMDVDYSVTSHYTTNYGQGYDGRGAEEEKFAYNNYVGGSLGLVFRTGKISLELNTMFDKDRAGYSLGMSFYTSK